MNKKKETYRALVLAVSILLTAPFGATASPIDRLAGSRDGLSSLWQWFTSLWGKEGSQIDPSGAGSYIDPSGDRSGSYIDPNGGASLTSPDEGSSIDPNGSR